MVTTCPWDSYPPGWLPLRRLPSTSSIGDEFNPRLTDAVFVTPCSRPLTSRDPSLMHIRTCPYHLTWCLWWADENLELGYFYVTLLTDIEDEIPHTSTVHSHRLHPTSGVARACADLQRAPGHTRPLEVNRGLSTKGRRHGLFPRLFPSNRLRMTRTSQTSDRHDVIRKIWHLPKLMTITELTWSRGPLVRGGGGVVRILDPDLSRHCPAAFASFLLWERGNGELIDVKLLWAWKVVEAPLSPEKLNEIASSQERAHQNE